MELFEHQDSLRPTSDTEIFQLVRIIAPVKYGSARNYIDGSVMYLSPYILIGYELLHKNNKTFMKAWKTGTTGYPLIDGCMRTNDQRGWVSFRMSAMLISFLTLNLDQNWRDCSRHLARQFLDYKPGIHDPQFQMQAGTTVINTVRLYNPVKNSQGHDPDGIFIKKWIPELTNIPVSYIHEIWRMTPMEQTFCGVVIEEDDPLSIIGLQESARIARDKIWGHKKHSDLQKQRKRLLNTHVNRTQNDLH